MIIQPPGNGSYVNEFYVGVKNSLATFQDPNRLTITGKAFPTSIWKECHLFVPSLEGAVQ